MSAVEAAHWRNVLIGLALPVLWGFGFTLYLVATRRGSVSDSIRALAVEGGYTMLAVLVTALFVGLLWHWFH